MRMRKSFKYSILSVLVAFTLVVAPIPYVDNKASACCGVQPVVTDLTPVAGQSFVTGDTVCFTGKITGTQWGVQPAPWNVVTIAIQIVAPNGSIINCSPTLSNYTQVSPSVATWDFKCCFVPTECGTYTYAKTAWWTAFFTIQSATVGGSFVVLCPRELKEDAIQELQVLKAAAGAAGLRTEDYDEAIQNIQASLNPAFWDDATHVNNGYVFDPYEDNACKEIDEDIIPLDPANTAQYQQIKGKLFKADEILAQTAINDGIAGGVSPEHMARAQATFGAAQAAAANGDCAAVKLYKDVVSYVRGALGLPF